MSKNSYCDSIRSTELQWFPELGLGYYPVQATPYDAAYFERYREMSQTPMGLALISARLSFVDDHLHPNVKPEQVIDVGIGSGQFVTAMGCKGYDVNPEGLKWLHKNDRFRNPYDGIQAITCWDSLEHIADPTLLLAAVRGTVFVSIPIFDDLDHVLRSKHYRKDEHFWYFTEPGLVRFMNSQGFLCAADSRMESDIGREDIGTYAFQRTRN